MVLKGQYIRIERASYNNSFEEIFDFGRVLVVLKGQYIRIERASYNNSFEEIFHFGRVLWS